MLRAADEILRLKTALSSSAQISRVSCILFFLAGKPCVRGQATTATAAMLFSTCASTYQIQSGVSQFKMVLASFHVCCLMPALRRILGMDVYFIKSKS